MSVRKNKVSSLVQYSVIVLCVLMTPVEVLFGQASENEKLVAPEPVDYQMVARIREEGFQRSQIIETLSYMTDVLGARLTNSRAMKRAQSWLVGELQSMGLANTQSIPFMEYGVSWDNVEFSLDMLTPDYQPMVGFPLAHTPGTGGSVELPVVIADVKNKSDLANFQGKLKGTAVLSSPPPTIDLERFSSGTPRRTTDELKAMDEEVLQQPVDLEGHFRTLYPEVNEESGQLSPVERLKFFEKEGVALIMESNSGWPGAVRGFARPGAKIDRWSQEATLNSVPIVAVTPEHYNRMYRILLKGIPVHIETEIENRHGEAVESAHNIVAEIPGVEHPEQIVMLGAHLDTWHASPNASDNTSGVVVMLEAMRILKELNVRPKRTIRVVFWGGEEQGLYGSRAYVQKHYIDGNDLYPEPDNRSEYDDFSVYFNQDYGPGEYRGIYLQGNEHVREIFRAWMKPLEDVGMKTISIQGVGSTDHIPFDEIGLPAFQFLQARTGGTGGHTNLDFFDTIPIQDLMKNAVIMATFVYHSAMRDEILPRKKLGNH
ncbi:MAG: M20/M25/M40 family metallo-hydrolase [bacterium]